MLQIKPQDVWSAWIPYEEDQDNGKFRPVVVMDVNDDIATVLSTPITSSAPRDEYDIEVFNWADIPLDHKSTARASKTIDIPIGDFGKFIGRLSNDDWENVTNLYMDYLSNRR